MQEEHSNENVLITQHMFWCHLRTSFVTALIQQRYVLLRHTLQCDISAADSFAPYATAWANYPHYLVFS